VNVQYKTGNYLAVLKRYAIFTSAGKNKKSICFGAP
jgi:hypothetical protein